MTFNDSRDVGDGLESKFAEVCLAHALMTEREEVMGLLLGQVEGTEALCFPPNDSKRSLFDMVFDVFEARVRCGSGRR